MARPHSGRYRVPPAERTPPFLLVPDGTGARVLVSPFPKRRRGLTPEQRGVVEAVAHALRRLPVLGGALWIDPSDGRATPAAIGEGQLRRRLFDCACFTVRG